MLPLSGLVQPQLIRSHDHLLQFAQLLRPMHEGTSQELNSQIHLSALQSAHQQENGD